MQLSPDRTFLFLLLNTCPTVTPHPPELLVFHPLPFFFLVASHFLPPQFVLFSKPESTPPLVLHFSYPHITTLLFWSLGILIFSHPIPPHPPLPFSPSCLYPHRVFSQLTSTRTHYPSSPPFLLWVIHLCHFLQCPNGNFDCSAPRVFLQYTGSTMSDIFPRVMTPIHILFLFKTSWLCPTFPFNYHFYQWPHFLLVLFIIFSFLQMVASHLTPWVFFPCCKCFSVLVFHHLAFLV